MSNIVLISDSACDLSSSLLAKYNVETVPFYISFDGTNYQKEIVDISIDEFYKKLRAEKVYPKTSLPAINDYVEKFTPYIEAGKSIICVTISSKFSGSYNAATNAREIILENYPNATIEIIDSQNATSGEGILVIEISRMISAGLEFSKIVDIARKQVETARIYFPLETLDYLVHGGRIGKATALVGSMLNIKPILELKEGELFPFAKVRGTKKALSRIIEATADYVGSEKDDYNYLVTQSDNVEYATITSENLKKEMNVEVEEDFSDIGTTVGVYVGPDAVGICLIKKYEKFL